VKILAVFLPRDPRYLGIRFPQANPSTGRGRRGDRRYLLIFSRVLSFPSESVGCLRRAFRGLGDLLQAVESPEQGFPVSARPPYLAAAPGPALGSVSWTLTHSATCLPSPGSNLTSTLRPFCRSAKVPV